MARPRTKSDPIQFRLPMPVYEHLAERAEAKGRTVPEHVVAILTSAFEAK
ncbi:MAG: Arc family DNA-binding protein [Rhodobacterales bacterium]|nr:Arc family DNA-binding protein [Rhodobacterales bacterium]